MINLEHYPTMKLPDKIHYEWGLDHNGNMKRHAIREYGINVPYDNCKECYRSTPIDKLVFYGNKDHPASCVVLCRQCSRDKGWR